MLCPITDLFEQLDKNKIKIIPLKNYDKRPLDKGYYDKKYTRTQIEKHQGNLGVCVGYNHDQEQGSLAVVDIDGLNGEYKKESQEYLMNILKNIPGSMMIQTQSGGYHLYFWNKTVLDNFHEVSKSLCFPENCPIPELRGKGLEHSIEIFTKWHTKYVVLPGSLIKTKADPNIREYCIINNVTRLSDITVVEDVGELIRKTLLDNGFTIKQKQNTNTSSINKTEQITKNTEFNRKQIKELIEILTPCFRKLTGARQESYMALTNYLLTYLPENTVKKIIHILTINTNDEEPSKRIETITRNQEHEGNKTGLPRLLENLENKGFNIPNIEFRIRKIVQKDYIHEILLEDGYKIKKYLYLDHNNGVISEAVCNRIKDKDEGDYYSLSKIESLLNLRIESIYESYNILDNNTPPKLCFRFSRKGMPGSVVLVGDNVLQIEKELETFSGVVLKPRKYKGLLNIIVTEYQRLGLLHQQFNAPVTGLFVNPLTNKLEWCIDTSYECENSGLIKDLNSIKPSVQEVFEGLDVWRRLGEHYKGDTKKLSHIIRWGILAPFSYILKQKQKYLPMLFLYGVSDTSKTMLGEISLCLYNSIDDNNSLGGLAASSVYQAGETFEKTTMGCIINEPGNVLDNANILDIYKRGIESTVCREKMDTSGKHIRIRAYNNFIWTSNNYVPQNDAFIKRTDYLEFTKDEQMTDEDKVSFVEEFNHVNWSNTDFLKLRRIGDFIVYYVYNHIDLLMKEHCLIVNELLDKLFEYSNHEVLEWLYIEADIIGFEETDNNILEELRLMILNDYNKITPFTKHRIIEDINEKLSINELGIYATDSEKEFRDNMLSLIDSNRLPYLFLNKDNEGNLYVGFRANIGKTLNKYTNNQLQITGKTLASIFGEEYKPLKIINTRTNIKGFRLSVDKFIDFLN